MRKFSECGLKITFTISFCTWRLLIISASEVESLVMILCPLLSPQHYLLQVALQILRCVAPEHVDDFLTVCLHSLLVDHLEDFTLHVVLQLFPRVSPEGKKDPDTITHHTNPTVLLEFLLYSSTWD